MSYNHLSIDERSCLQFYYVQGFSVRKISKLLNRSPSTISREIRRNCWQLVRGVFYYYAATAQRKARRRKRFCHRGKTLEKNLAFINARPKKVLSYVSPQDLFNSFLSKCCT